VRTSWLGGRGSCSHESRKVRTSQSRVIANSNPRRLAGKCHRKQTATLVVVRVKRCGKSAPASRVTGMAWQTPPEARSRRPRRKVRSRRRLRAARPSLRVGRLRHPATVCPDGWSPPCRRCLRRGGGEQNPAYRPTRPPLRFRAALPDWVSTDAVLMAHMYGNHSSCESYCRDLVLRQFDLGGHNRLRPSVRCLECRLFRDEFAVGDCRVPGGPGSS
jgi:hypothetical protein